MALMQNLNVAIAGKARYNAEVTKRVQRVLQYAQHLLSTAITDGDIVVDATAGNGRDTLRRLVGDNGKVYALI